MRHASITFESAPTNDIEIGRIEYLKDILKIVAGSTNTGYQCNVPTNPITFNGRK